MISRIWSPPQVVGRRLLFISALLASGALMSSCGSSTAGPGTIDGQISLAGGPAPGIYLPTNGNVVATGKGGVTFSTAVSANGKFVIHLPIGTYSLSGSSPHYDGGQGKCLGPDKITVYKNVATRADVICLEK